MAGRVTYALFSALYAPHMGGVESYTAGLADELARRGNRVVVATSRLASDHPERETQPNGVEVLRLPCHSLLGGRLPVPRRNARHRQLLGELAAMNPERVVINTRFYGHSLDGARFAARQAVPALVIEHGSAHLSLGNALADHLVEAYEHQATNRIKRFDIPFYGVSGACVRWLEHFGIEGAGVIANSLDMEAYAKAASPRNFRSELGIGDDTTLVASVGRLVPEKGVAELLEAARQLEGEGFAFAFAGDGPLLERVRKAGAETFALGRLATPDVAALLRASDVYCLPSRSEGFATTLLEACAMEAFPITTAIGGAEELGIGRTGGTILPDMSAASIVKALRSARSNQAECAAQAACLRKAARAANSWQNSADALERAFAEISKERCDA